MLYRLLIVDDEYLVTEGLKNLVDWKKYGFQLVGIASNGEEGIREARQKTPDIVITDIKMPVMDGLDMIKLIRDMNPHTNFIVLSGYDNFEWAKQAFKYGVADYLLKPVDFNQLDTVLKKLKERMDKARNENNNKLLKEAAADRGLTLLKKEAITELLKGRYASVDSMLDKLKAASVDLEDKPCICMIFKEKDSAKTRETETISALTGLFRKIIEYTTDKKIGYGTEMEEGLYVLVLVVPDENMEWAKIYAEYIYTKFQLEKTGVIIGIGGVYRNPARIKYSYIEASQALEYQYLKGSYLICYDDIRNQCNNLEKVHYPARLENTVLEGIRLNDRQKVLKALETFYGDIRKTRVDIVHFRNIMTEFLFVLKKELNSINIDLSKVFVDEYEEINSIKEKSGIDGVWELVTTFI